MLFIYCHIVNITSYGAVEMLFTMFQGHQESILYKNVSKCD